MADSIFNIAKLRVGEFYNRVKSNDPANSVLLIIPLETTGLEADAVLLDKDTLADVLSGTTNEQTTMGRKSLDNTLLAAYPAPDDTLNRLSLVLPSVTWVTAGGNPISKLLVAYDGDSTSGTDANILPLTLHDFVKTPNGSDITATTAEWARGQ